MWLKMNKTKEVKKVSSIAIKLNSIYARNIFVKFLCIDILLLVLFLNWMNNEGQYILSDPDGFIYSFEKIGATILVFQGILLLIGIIFGTSQIRKNLKPLNDIAEKASILSNLSFDESKVQNLEDAILKISPTIIDERINTGDNELHGLEDAINNLLERMRESYKQQARFVSDASHELRTPISVINGYANMLDRWGKEDENILNESILAIKSESENMNNLVEQLLFLARGVNGNTQLKYKEFSLNDMINGVLEESSMIDEKHVYKYNNCVNITVNADEGLLKQCVRILIENAAKYTQENEEIVLATGITEMGMVYFSVQDNGIGIDESDIQHIFERFFRADSARGRETGGTGLGLSIAKWIIDNHKGYFSVLSRKGIGTRITVLLPN